MGFACSSRNWLEQHSVCWPPLVPKIAKSTYMHANHQYADGLLVARSSSSSSSKILPVLPPTGRGKELTVTQEVQWSVLCLHKHTSPEQLCRTCPAYHAAQSTGSESISNCSSRKDSRFLACNPPAEVRLGKTLSRRGLPYARMNCSPSSSTTLARCDHL